MILLHLFKISLNIGVANLGNIFLLKDMSFPSEVVETIYLSHSNNTQVCIVLCSTYSYNFKQNIYTQL